MPNPEPLDQVASTPELSVRVTPQTPIVEGDSATVSISITPPPSSATPVNFTIGGEGITPADYTITMEDGTELSESGGVIAVTIPANVPTVLLTITMVNDSDGAETLAFTVQDSADGQYTLKSMNSSINISIEVRLPSARYDATTGVLTFTEIDLVDVPGTDDDVDISKLSVVGKGGTASAISLTVAPTISTVTTSEFSLTVDTADRTNMLKALDIGGDSASDGNLYSIVLEQNWNGAPSSAHASIPVRTSNFPPGYCGDFSENPVVINGTEHAFFDSGTGTMAAPYQLRMRIYCDELLFYWTGNYPAPADGGLFNGYLYFDIILSTAGTYEISNEHVILTAPGFLIVQSRFFDSMISTIAGRGFNRTDPPETTSPAMRTVPTVPTTMTVSYQLGVTPEPFALDATQGILFRIQ